MYDLKGATLDGHPSSRGDVVIGNDVWLGAGCTVMSGVTISDGAVVGAHAVVDRDVRPYAVVVGNRAREVRRRFDDRTVDRLLELKWWDWNDERVVNSINLLSSPPSSLDGLSWPAP
jgi:serine acetyltransferase